jgi:hypothetical protein
MPEVESKEDKLMIEKICEDEYDRVVLRYFARHPYTHFDEQVLFDGLGLNDSGRIERTLEHLSELKLLEIKAGHGLCIYWLTRQEPLQTAVRSFFALKNDKSNNTQERPDMMQFILPLASCRLS